MERNMAWNRILPARKATVAAMTIVMMLGACSQRPDTGQDVGQDVGQDAGLNTGQVVRWDAGRDSGMGASSLAEASDGSVERIEPPCWWVGMKTPLQLMVYGEDIGQCTEVRFEGLRGVKVAAIHPADSPNYLFVDLKIGRGTRPGTGRLVFTRKGAQTKRQDDPASQAGVTDQRDRKRGGERFSYPYTIGARPDDRGRQSFSSEDVIYLIVPDRFANGDPSNDETPDTEDFADPGQPNARHGGDIQGIIDHLDYLEDLGVTALWPTPLLEDNAPRVSYHGYACSDYYRIDPRFGDNDLYFRMVRKAHERGIKILMDVVTNHCGSSHPWMQDLPLRDWVHVHEPYTNTNHVMSAAFDPYASRSDREQMESGWFVPSMPDMNLDNPFVLKYFQQWAVWWVAASGLDGFRVDTWFYNEKGPMSRWARAVRDEFPWLNIVGEVWSLQPDQVAYWQEGHPNPDGFDAGLPTVMDFPMMDAIQRAVSPSEDEAYQSRTGDLRAVYDALSHDFALTDPEHILLFFSNHDTPRMADFCEGDPARMRLALTLLATLRGIPQLFYGEEWMLRTGSTRRDDGRVRMDLFAAADEAGPAGRAGSGGSIPGKGKTPAAAATRSAGPAPDAGVYEYTRALLRWRKGCPAVHHGKTLHFLPQDNTYAYFRYDDRTVVMVFLNRSGQTVAVPWQRFSEITAGLGEGRNPITGATVQAGAELSVGPCEALVLEFKK